MRSSTDIDVDAARAAVAGDEARRRRTAESRVDDPSAATPAADRRDELTTVSETACTIGVDFGTESGRVLVLDLTGGAELAVEVVPYQHGVIDRSLPGGGEPLSDDWALQHPSDWTDVIEQGVPAAVRAAGVSADADRRDRRRLHLVHGAAGRCRRDAAVPDRPRWRDRRHAWPKLWKHHAAQDVADRLNEVALERDEPFLERYGGRISSEWYFPKLIEVWVEDREVYDACDVFLEATDWIVWWLTGQLVRQSTTAGYKAMWSPVRGPAAGRLLRGGLPRVSISPAEKLGTRLCAARHPGGGAAPRARGPAGTAGHGRGGGRQRRLVRVGAGRRRRARAHLRDGDRHLDLRHGRGPDRGAAAGDHRRRPGRDPPGAVRLRGRPSRGRRHARLVRAHARRRRHRLCRARGAGRRGRTRVQRTGRAGLVQRQPDDPRRRRPDRLDPRA